MRRILFMLVAGLALTALSPPTTAAQDLTGTWDVKAHFCQTDSGGPKTGCSITGPTEIAIQALDAYRFLIRPSAVGPALRKCVLVPTLNGKTLIGCVRCGSGDLYQAHEVDDLATFAEVWSGKVLSADKLKLEGYFVEAFDISLAPGVQPATSLVKTKWQAKRRDAVSPGLTDCSTP
jgi:hypothetical protein